MPQSLTQIWLHIVFSTKNRVPLFRNESFQDQMHRMLAFHLKELGSTVGSVGGYEDHVHILTGLPRTMSISKLVGQVKTETSKWAKTIDHGSRRFAWQSGYGAFSVSHSNMDQVLAYIRNQRSHHAKLSFKDEFRFLCSRHGISIDERYVFGSKWPDLRPSSVLVGFLPRPAAPSSP